MLHQVENVLFAYANNKAQDKPTHSSVYCLNPKVNLHIQAFIAWSSRSLCTFSRYFLRSKVSLHIQAFIARRPRSFYTFKRLLPEARGQSAHSGIYCLKPKINLHIQAFIASSQRSSAFKRLLPTYKIIGCCIINRKNETDSKMLLSHDLLWYFKYLWILSSPISFRFQIFNHHVRSDS